MVRLLFGGNRPLQQPLPLPKHTATQHTPPTHTLKHPHLRRHDVARHHHDVLHLGARLVALRDVHVHLVAVKVGVVRRRDRQVEAVSFFGFGFGGLSSFFWLSVWFCLCFGCCCCVRLG